MQAKMGFDHFLPICRRCIDRKARQAVPVAYLLSRPRFRDSACRVLKRYTGRGGTHGGTVGVDTCRHHGWGRGEYASRMISCTENIFSPAPSPPVWRLIALATRRDFTYVCPSSATTILCPPTERQEPHGDDKGVTEWPAGNRIEDARARRDPSRITTSTAADPFGSGGPLSPSLQRHLKIGSRPDAGTNQVC